MQYPESFIAPMRAELAQAGFTETRTPDDVDRLLAPDSGTVLMVVNSICGCAAGKARPGVIESLRHSVVPDHKATVFAGGDIEATARVRERLSGFPPSSPSVALFRDGEPVFMLHRSEIEGRMAPDIAMILRAAYDEHCKKTVA